MDSSALRSSLRGRGARADLAVVLLSGAPPPLRRAPDFFAAVFPADGFRADGFLADGFLAAGFFALDLRAGAFLAGDFFAVVF